MTDERFENRQRDLVDKYRVTIKEQRYTQFVIMVASAILTMVIATNIYLYAGRFTLLAEAMYFGGMIPAGFMSYQWTGLQWPRLRREYGPWIDCGFYAAHMSIWPMLAVYLGVRRVVGLFR